MVLQPLVCCAAFAEKIGKKPSMSILCPPCENYRHFMTDQRYAVKAGIIPSTTDAERF